MKKLTFRNNQLLHHRVNQNRHQQHCFFFSSLAAGLARLADVMDFVKSPKINKKTFSFSLLFPLNFLHVIFFSRVSTNLLFNSISLLSFIFYCFNELKKVSECARESRCIRFNDCFMTASLPAREKSLFFSFSHFFFFNQFVAIKGTLLTWPMK